MKHDMIYYPNRDDFIKIVNNKISNDWICLGYISAVIKIITILL